MQTSLSHGWRMILKCVALGCIVTAACWGLENFTSIPLRSTQNRLVRLAIRTAKESHPATRVVVLGDSVCAQLYPPGTGGSGIVSLASNFGVTMIGQRLLLETWLDANPTVTNGALYLVVNPASLGNGVDSSHTYNNLIKGFWISPWKERFDDEEKRYVHAFPWVSISQFPPVRLSSWCPTFVPSFPEQHKLEDGGLTPISLQEVKRMGALARNRGMRFTVLAGIRRESARSLDTPPRAARFAQPEVGDVFGEYLTSSRFLPDDLFVDALHLSTPQALGSDPLKLLMDLK